MIVSDNGTALTSHAVLSWVETTGIEWHYIAPGKPVPNAFVESFNGRLRNECLNEHVFRSLYEAPRRSLADRLHHRETSFEPRQSRALGVRKPARSNGPTEAGPNL